MHKKPIGERLNQLADSSVFGEHEELKMAKETFFSTQTQSFIDNYVGSNKAKHNKIKHKRRK